MWAPMQSGGCPSKEGIWTEMDIRDAGAQRTDLVTARSRFHYLSALVSSYFLRPYWRGYFCEGILEAMYLE